MEMALDAPKAETVLRIRLYCCCPRATLPPAYSPVGVKLSWSFGKRGHHPPVHVLLVWEPPSRSSPAVGIRLDDVKGSRLATLPHKDILDVPGRALFSLARNGLTYQ